MGDTEKPPVISPKLMKRIISALILAPVALFVFLYHPTTFIAAVVFFFILSVWEWTDMTRRTSGGSQVLMALTGVVYLPMCFLAFAHLRFLPDGAYLILTLFLSVWASDTGAFVVGKTAAGPKWVPSVSPNKTWSGLGGAMVFCAIVLTLMMALAPLLKGLVANTIHLSAYQLLVVYIYGLALGLVCQIGDVFISVFKRRAGVKDTGTFIPGHGGVLDRIDALMAASALFYVTLRVMG